MNTLRILCFNIHGGYDTKGHRDLRRVHTLMDELDVDIGVFQEMETRPSRGGTAEDVDILCGSERPHHLPGPTMKEGKGWYGNLLVSRYPIKRAVVHDLEKNHQVLEPRNAVDALIDTPLEHIRIVGTHLSLSSFMRWWEIQNLIKLVNKLEDEAKCPVLFMGDFNEWFWASKLIKHLDELMTPLPSGKTFPSLYPIFRLDRVWCDNLNSPVRAEILNRPHIKTLSDHLPVLIEIEKPMEKA